MSDYISKRRRRAEAALATDHIVLIGSGSHIAVPGGMDRIYPFKPHPHHYWLTGHMTPGAVLAYDANEGWRDFTPDLTEDDYVWEGITERAGEPISGLGPHPSRRYGPSPTSAISVASLAGRLRLSDMLGVSGGRPTSLTT